MNDLELIKVVPSVRQMRLMDMEFYAFIHFTVNTFTNNEWGAGTEDPAIFNPYKLDAEQWVTAIKDAGMKGIILTCKHHDGFCLWHTKYTSHSVLNSPFKRDIVKELTDACKKHGLLFGVYLSPWDRHEKAYGTGKEYDDYFVNQLTELLTNYGEIFSVWFDGACGEGPNGKKQYYDFERYYALIRELQPMATIHVCGPDIRWCGNEAGDTRPSEWSVVPARTLDTEKIKENSQKADCVEFRERKITATDLDLGSREILKDETKLVFYPAEVNTSIRPGWFWHENENDKVRSVDVLFDIYLKSVGGNATFLLNVPPTNEGLFHENDVKTLKELGNKIKASFDNNLLDTAKISCDANIDGENVIENVREDSYLRYFKPKDGDNKCEIVITWDDIKPISYVVLKENLTLSQRIEKVSIFADDNGKLVNVYEGTVVGHKRIAPVKVNTNKLVIKIDDSRVAPTLSFIGVY